MSMYINVYWCIYTYIYIYMNVYIYIYIYIHINLHIMYMCIYICVCIYICICLHMYIYICIYAYIVLTYIHICVLYIYVYMYLCTHIYMYVYILNIHMYIHIIYVYVYIHSLFFVCFVLSSIRSFFSVFFPFPLFFLSFFPYTCVLVVESQAMFVDRRRAVACTDARRSALLSRAADARWLHAYAAVRLPHRPCYLDPCDRTDTVCSYLDGSALKETAVVGVLKNLLSFEICKYRHHRWALNGRGVSSLRGSVWALCSVWTCIGIFVRVAIRCI